MGPDPQSENAEKKDEPSDEQPAEAPAQTSAAPPPPPAGPAISPESRIPMVVLVLMTFAALFLALYAVRTM